MVFVILFISLVYGAVTSVTLDYPSNDAINNTSDDIILGCSGIGTNLVNMTLYSNITSSNGEFVAVETKDYTTSGEIVEFSFNNVDNDTYTWNCLLTDEENTRVFHDPNYTLTVSFAKIGFSGTIPDQSLGEDSNLTNAFNLSKYFSNANYYTVSGNNHIAVGIIGGNVSLYPEDDWNGTESITFTGTENVSSVSSSLSTSISVTVIGINDAPVLIANISNQTLYKNGNKTIDLSNYFDDIDTSLTYSYSSLSHFSVEINGDNIKFTPEQDWTGYENVVLTASDGNYSVSSNSFKLTVNDVGNHAPEITSYYPLSVSPILQGESQLFNLSYYDEDGDNVTISWYLNGVLVGTGSYYEFENIEEGNYTLMAEINDGTTNSSISWEFNVVSELGGLDTGNQTGICGNGIVDPGEDCDNCKIDVRCGENEICKERECVAVKKIPFLTTFIILLIFIAGYIIFMKYENKKKFGIDMSKIEKARKELSEEKPEGKLENYVKDTLKKGFSIEDVEKNLLKSGWKKEEIKKVMGELKENKLSEEDIKSIKIYIKKMLKQGYGSDKIREDLLKSGWNKKEIKIAFDELKR